MSERGTEGVRYQVFLPGCQYTGCQVVVGSVKGLQQFGTVLYPGFQADAGTGRCYVGEIEYGQLLETVGTVLQLVGGRMTGNTGCRAADTGVVWGLCAESVGSHKHKSLIYTSKGTAFCAEWHELQVEIIYKYS